MGVTPTKYAIMGTFINGRNDQNDFLQFATNNGDSVFAWIDAQGLLQGSFAPMPPLWSSLQAPVADLTLATTTFNTTFNSTVATTWKWQNQTLSTAILDQPSPALELGNHFWVSSDQSNTFKIQASGGFLKFSSPQSTFNQVFPYQFDSSVQASGSIQTTTAQFNFNTGNAGAVYAVSAAGNQSAGLTTYTAVVGGGGQPLLGQNITIAGFIVNPGNNGTFVVHDSTLSTITVYNSGGVAETQAATATLDLDYHGLGGFSVNIASAASPAFPISGVTQPAGFQLNAFPNAPAMVSTVKGDVKDAAYWRIVNDGATGNHGLEIGAIVDGVGTNIAKLQLGTINSTTLLAVLNCPLVIAGVTPTGNSGQLSIGTTTGFGTGSAGTAVTTTTKGGGTGPTTPQTVVDYLEIDIAGTKYWIPLVQ